MVEVPDSRLDRITQERLLARLGSSRCSLEGTGCSVRVVVDTQASPNVCEKMRAVAGDLGRVSGRWWTLEGPAEVRALAAFIQDTLRTCESTGSLPSWICRTCPASRVAREMQEAAAAGSAAVGASASASTASQAVAPPEGTPAPAPASSLRRCAACGAHQGPGEDSKPKRCRGCRCLTFCNAGYQRRGWQGGHKQLCPLLRDLESAPRASRVALVAEERFMPLRTAAAADPAGAEAAALAALLGA